MTTSGSPQFFEKLESVSARFDYLDARLADPELSSRPDEFRKLSKERAQLEEIVSVFRRYKSAQNQLQSNRSLLEESDPELRQMAKEDMLLLEPEIQQLEDQLRVLLLPRDPRDEKDVFLEIRAGAGGDEAALFVGEMFRMYRMYSEGKGWRVEVMNAHATGGGGFKEIIASISGEKVYSFLKYEAGVHRVQRVPDTEGAGRVHTSTITVAIMPEADDVDVHIRPEDLRIDVYRSGGAGGQGVNTTDSAVRITHLPTGLVVACQDERSQHKNKDKAMKILKARLLEAEREKQDQAIADARRSQVGTGDRSERIRTYNFPQSRITDHRIGLTVHNIHEVMDGHLNEVVKALTAFYQSKLLEEASQQ